MLAGGLSKAPAIKRVNRRRRYVLAVEAALAVAALWLIGPRLAALRVAGPVGAALLLVLLSWGCAFVIELTIFFAVSWDDFLDLLLSSLCASAPAMWFAPAILLLATPSRFALAMGLLLVANTMRLLVSRNVPQKLAPVTLPPRRRDRLFRYATSATDAPFWREALPPVLGALALQMGLCGIWTGHQLYSAALIACGAAIWTWSSIARGAMRRNEKRASHWLLSVALTFLLATVLSFAQVGGSELGLLETMRRAWQQLQYEPPPKPPQVSRPTVARLISPQRNAAEKAIPKKTIGAPGTDLTPGVILREAKPLREPLSAPPSTRTRNNKPGVADQPVTIPFSGEYRLYPSSSAGLKHGWSVESGTLLEHVYSTTLGGSLETEAFQRFHPPVDFAGCGKIRLTLASEEEGPFGVTMELAVEDGLVDLGSEAMWFDRRGEETLEFTVPAGSRNLLVGAIRMVFHRIPRQGGQSMRVAVRGFTLVPR